VTPRRLTYAIASTALVISGAAFLAFAREGDAEATIEIDSSRTFQTIGGWEATIDLPDNEKGDPLLKARDWLFDKAVDDLGLNRVRLEIRSGAESRSRSWDRYQSGELTYKEWRPFRYTTENDNDDPNVIDWSGFDFSELDQMIEQQVEPLRGRLAARGETLFVNLCYVAFTKQIKGGAYIHDDPDEYAEFILATSLHIRDKYGFEPDSWEVILEPDLVPQWTPRRVGDAIVATAERLEENGFTPRFVAPSVTNTANAPRFIDAIARVDGAMRYVSEFSYHRYRMATQTNVREIARRGEKFDKPTSMLELWFGRANSRVLFEDLTVGNVSAFQGRTLFGHFKVADSGAGAARISYNKEIAENRQVYKYVRAGAVRIGAGSDRNTATPAAFVNPDGGMVVAIRMTEPATVRLTGMRPGAYAVSYASGGKIVDDAGSLTIGNDGKGEATMPAAGVMTIAASTSGRDPTADSLK